MIDILKGHLASLESDLKTLHREDSDILALSRKAMLRIRESCKDLALIKLKYEFQNKQEEIYFFKELKAVFYSKLFYYTDIFTIEAKRPNGTEKIKRKFFKELRYIVSEHFNSHRFLYQYYRTGQCEWDERYFSLIKRFEDKYDVNGTIVQCDDDYSSTHDMLFARVMANDLLEVYLNKELDKLNGIKSHDPVSEITTINPNRKFKWTASKAALTEFVYALISAKSINDGNVDIKEVMEFVETVFGIDTGDFYRTYVELRSRNNQTRFLDSLRTALLNRMSEDDEKDFHDPLSKK